MSRRPAVLGGTPALDLPVVHGRGRLPEASRVAHRLREVFARRYFANHGPLVRCIEQRLAELFGMTAVATVNDASAIAICAHALDMGGPVLVPRQANRARDEGLRWAGASPIPAPAAQAAGLAAPAVRGVVYELRWSSEAAMRASAGQAGGLPLLSLALDEYGTCLDPRRPSIGPGPDAVVLSFAGHGLSAAGGGACILVADQGKADRIRTIRSFHAQETLAAVTMRMNGKMSEAQAALILTVLEEIPVRAAAWRAGVDVYRAGLTGLEGLTLVLPPDGAIGEIALKMAPDGGGLDPDGLFRALARENIHCGRESADGLLLPAPIAITPEQIGKIAESVASIWLHRAEIASRQGAS